MNATDVVAIILEAVVIVALVPVIAVAWRGEVRRRRFRRLIADLSPRIVELQTALVALGRAFESAAPAFKSFADAMRGFGERGA